jgi:hypothetical protein
VFTKTTLRVRARSENYCMLGLLAACQNPNVVATREATLPYSRLQFALRTSWSSSSSTSNSPNAGLTDQADLALDIHDLRLHDQAAQRRKSPAAKSRAKNNQRFFLAARVHLPC